MGACARFHKNRRAVRSEVAPRIGGKPSPESRVSWKTTNELRLPWDPASRSLGKPSHGKGRTVDYDVRDHDDHRTARRRLIKGSFSAPALLTLASGSAWAMSSSRCIANDAAQQIHPGVQTGATYLQVQIYTFAKGNTTAYWVRGADLQAIATAAGVGCFQITTTQYLCMVGGKAPSGPTDYLAGAIYDNSTDPAMTPDLLATLAGNYYAVSVDRTGNIIGVDSVIKTGSGGAVHMTCWSSLRP
jgi:hypothetical protein